MRAGRIALGAALLALSLPASATAAAKENPDLTVRSVKITLLPRSGPPHIFPEGDGMVMTVTVKNVGKRASKGAGKLIARGNGVLRPDKVVFDVPKLRPGKSEKVDFDVRSSDLSGITTYETKACASVRRDENHKNDCKRGPGFAVVPIRWRGRTDGLWTDGAVIQSLTVRDATFTYDELTSEATGTFVYEGSGSLFAKVTGSLDSDCSFSGSGSTFVTEAGISTATLALDTDLLSYRGLGRLDETTATYTAQGSCFGGPPASFQQAFGDWFETAITPREATDEVLAGSQFVDSALNWSWNLRAAER